MTVRDMDREPMAGMAALMIFSAALVLAVMDRAAMDSVLRAAMMRKLSI